MKKHVITSLLILANISLARGGGGEGPVQGRYNFDFKSYIVYASNSIHAECSDFLGTIGSGGDIALRDFLISGSESNRCAIESEGTLFMRNGRVENENYRRSCVATSRAKTKGTERRGRRNYKVDHNSIQKQIQAYSSELLEVDSQKVKKLSITTHTLSGVLKLDLDQEEIIIVEFLGEDVSIENLTVDTDLSSRRIIWHFPNAKRVSLKFSGVPLSTGRHVGMPGEFVAPKANFYFNNALITGKLYVYKLIGLADSMDCRGIVSGQVNPHDK